ncbi:nucleotide excision repair endonuclease [Bdellovibrionota bacterium FG-2]
MNLFDRKFGKDFLDQVPSKPGIYLFVSEGKTIYVGQSKNLHRRLGQYKNAKRRKKHAKMRAILAGAASLKFEVCDTHEMACLRETSLIQSLRPKWNTAGAFSFLYPQIGIAHDGDRFWLCYSTRPEDLNASLSATVCLGFHGSFRSRSTTLEAFFALSKLLSYLGYRLPTRSVFGKHWRQKMPRYSLVTCFRQISNAEIQPWDQFFSGESPKALEALTLQLLEKATARSQSRLVEEHLKTLRSFWRHEARPLREARNSCGFTEYPVPQKMRDPIFIRNRFQKVAATASVSESGL